MNTLKKSFELMGQNLGAVAKLIGLNLLSSILLVIGIAISMVFRPLLLVIIPAVFYYAFIQVQAYRLWFCENHEATMGDIFSNSFESLKRNGLRYLGFSCFMGLLFIGLFLIFVIFMFNLIFTNGTVVIGGMFALIVILPALGLFMYLPQYIYVFIALGIPKATRTAFSHWKSILICGLISTGLNLIPAIGTIASMVFAFVMPLKIILDSEMSSDETILNHPYQDTKTYEF